MKAFFGNKKIQKLKLILKSLIVKVKTVWPNTNC